MSMRDYEDQESSLTDPVQIHFDVCFPIPNLVLTLITPVLLKVLLPAWQLHKENRAKRRVARTVICGRVKKKSRQHTLKEVVAHDSV